VIIITGLDEVLWEFWLIQSSLLSLLGVIFQ
jgi:hypothetical protein